MGLARIVLMLVGSGLALALLVPASTLAIDGLEVDAGTDKTVRVGSSVNFNDARVTNPDPLNASRSYNFSWDFDDREDSNLDGINDNDNDSRYQFISFTYQLAGVYTVTLTVDDGYEVAKDTLQVTVRPNEPPVIHANDTEEAVAGAPHFFNAEAIDDADQSSKLVWEWDFGDGTTTSGAPPVSRTYLTVGDYEVLIRVTDTEGASSTHTIALNVTLPPSDDLTVFVGQDKVARVQVPVEFRDSVIIKPDPPNPERTYTHSWDFDIVADSDMDGVFDNDAQSNEWFAQWTYHMPGTYVVTLTVDDGYYSAKDALKVTVVANQPPEILANDTETDVVTLDHVFYAYVTDDYSPVHMLRWHWTFGDGTTSDDPPPVIHAFMLPGVHEVDVRVTDPDNEYSEHTFTITITEPSVDIRVDLEDGEVLKGTVMLTGSVHSLMAFDEVMLRFDVEDIWYIVDGVDEWTYQLDTTDLAFGEHTLEIRASLKLYFTEAHYIDFLVDQPPEVSIQTTNDTEVYTEDFEVRGVGYDDGRVTQVQYRIDDGEWVNVTDETRWRIEVDVDALDPGMHTLEVRIYDGRQYSETGTFAFEVGAGKDSPGFGALVTVLCTTMMAAVLAHRRNVTA